MASIESRANKDGTITYRVRFRLGGRGSQQQAVAFGDPHSAERFRRDVEALGAQAALDLLDAREQGSPDMTVQQWCLEHIDAITGVTEGTRVRYRSIARKGLGALANLPLTAITKAAVGKWVNALEAQGLASKTIANRHGFLYAAMESAVAAGHIEVNPCASTRLPEGIVRDMVFLTHGEFAVLTQYIRPDALDLVHSLAGTGQRFGEATALQVQDWDSERGIIRITRAWKYSGVSSRPTLGPPKTKRGRRSYRVAPEIAEIYDRLTRDKAPEDFIFTNSKGDPWRAPNFHSAVWQPAVACANGEDYQAKRAEWESGRPFNKEGRRVPWRTPAEKPLGKRPRIHDLRHSWASWMLAAGVPIIEVSRRLGHESIKTTVDIYGHLTPEGAEAAINATSAALSPAMPQIEG